MTTQEQQSFDGFEATSAVIQSKDQSNPSDVFSPKARKPYTITKQREKWSDEEHSRFIEALRLYGRTWRKIEEHIGTKTAVQIRSHAQKFFCKMVRDSNMGDADHVDIIEIPPPRPKRKPVHPYPRKQNASSKPGLAVEKPVKSALESPPELENQSPKSLLSALASESSGGTDSFVPNSSPSSATSPLVNKIGDVSCSGVLRDGEDEHSSLDDQMLEEPVTEDPNESSGKFLKLFGKTLVIAETGGPSSSIAISSHEQAAASILIPVRVIPLKFAMMNETHMDVCYPIALPWLTLCANSSTLPCEDTKEQSSTDSNSDSASGTTQLSRKASKTPTTNSRKGFRPYKKMFTRAGSP